MPLRGERHSDLVRDEVPYFTSLAELDAWFSQPHDKLSGVLPYQPRPHVSGPDTRPKLLVCHDYKGGYTESPSGLCYTFNFWRLCDTFVYFSHNRVAVPPSAWINAAHKQGTRILGTLIFEGLGSVLDSLQLIVGHSDHVITDDKIQISNRYAVFLAELAHQRGFDGYLLNFEFDLPYKIEQARALSAWILLLRAELRAKVGPHTQVVWYDSVIYDGRVKYQNRLNGYNLPFFLASDALYTNYWWTPESQSAMTQYFKDLRDLAPNSDVSTTHATPTRTLQSIYSGVDVWPGRYQYGDSGYCCYRAITYTAPLGFSTAIFAPGWTWEWVTENPERNWNRWWENDRRLWLGPIRPGEIVPVPDSPEGLFKPMTTFFQDLPPPDPSNFVFYTNFSPGVGYSWFVEGRKVLDTQDGWTDIDKQSSIGNLVWPWPLSSWEGALQELRAPTGSTTLDMTDGYNGGNTLKLMLEYAGPRSDTSAKVIWLPVQSLVVTTRVSFEARVVYKATAHTAADLDAHIYVKSFPDEESSKTTFTLGQVESSNLPHGWIHQTIEFSATSTQRVSSVAIGFLLGVKPKEPSAKVRFSLSLGQLAVYPTSPPKTVSIGTPSVTDAKFVLVPHSTDAADALQGVLTWDTWSMLPSINVEVDDKESITPAWLLSDTPAYRFPTFVYFNIYAALLDLSADLVDPTNALFVGTTGQDGRANRFFVDRACLPNGWNAKISRVRFYIQGVTDRGEVLPWSKCATVDYVPKTPASE